MSIVGLGGMAADHLHWKEAGGSEDEMVTGDQGDQGDQEQVRERLQKCCCRNATDFDAFFSMTISLLGDPAIWPLVEEVAKIALKTGLLNSNHLDNLSRSAPAMSAEFWRSLEAKRAEYLAKPPLG